MDPFFDGAPTHVGGTLPLDHGISVSDLFMFLNHDTHDVQQTLSELGKGGISIADMFEMQMLMNKLSQLSEMSSNVVSASNSAISNLVRHLKG